MLKIFLCCLTATGSISYTPVPLEVVIEVFEDVDWIEHREERRVWILDVKLQGALAKFSEELNVGFVTICQDQLHVKSNTLKLSKNIVEMLKQ